MRGVWYLASAGVATYAGLQLGRVSVDHDNMLEISLLYEKSLVQLNPGLNSYQAQAEYTTSTGMDLYINSIGKIPPTAGSKRN
jgi:hypothetical protein